MVLRTDQRGLCGVYFVAPRHDNYQSSVTATVGRGEAARQVVFVERTNDGATETLEPYMPTDCVGSVSVPDENNVTLTWTNHAPDAAWIQIRTLYDDGSSRLIMTLPPTATSAFVSGDAWRP